MRWMQYHHKQVHERAAQLQMPPVAVLAHSPAEFESFIHTQPESCRQYVYIGDRRDLEGREFFSYIRLPGWWTNSMGSRTADEIEQKLEFIVGRYQALLEKSRR